MRCKGEGFETTMVSEQNSDVPPRHLVGAGRAFRTQFFSRLVELMFDNSWKGAVARRLLGWTGDVKSPYMIAGVHGIVEFPNAAVIRHRVSQIRLGGAAVFRILDEAHAADSCIVQRANLRAVVSENLPRIGIVQARTAP